VRSITEIEQWILDGKPQKPPRISRITRVNLHVF
jgi:hypothetical protein